MTTKTLMDAKVGDVVTLRGQVIKVLPKESYVHVFFGGGAYNCIEFNTPPENIVSIEPAPLKVGDEAMTRCSRLRGKILATHGAAAWVLFDQGPLTFALSDLERVS